VIRGMKVARPLVKIVYDELREEQKAIADHFETPEDAKFGRKIYWLWEAEGGWGKSVLCKYFVDQMDAYCVMGAGKDVLCGVAGALTAGADVPIVIFDVPRCNKGAVSYQAMESLKNGLFFNAKYESKMCRFNCPHIIVFSNQAPDDLTKMTEDRWRVVELTKGEAPDLSADRAVRRRTGTHPSFISLDSDED